MAVLRFVSVLFFLLAVVAISADATPLAAGDVTLKWASVLQRWGEVAPAVLNGAQQSFANKGIPWVWTSLIVPVLSLPATVLFGGLGLVFGYLGRHRRRIKVFVNQ